MLFDMIVVYSNAMKKGRVKFPFSLIHIRQKGGVAKVMILLSKKLHVWFLFYFHYNLLLRYRNIQNTPLYKIHIQRERYQ